MSIKIGSLTIADTYFGSSPISAIYQGSNLIWQRGPVTDEPFYITSDEAFDIKLTKTGTVNAVPEISTD